MDGAKLKKQKKTQKGAKSKKQKKTQKGGKLKKQKPNRAMAELFERVSCESLYETINLQKLSFILGDRATLNLIRGENPNAFQSQMKTMQSYIERTDSNGMCIVRYFQRNGKGRRYVEGAQGLQSFERRIRHTICDNKYTDIDIVNAHPVIIQQLCKENKIECKQLQIYNANREERLESLGDDRSRAKQAVLSVIYGGKKAMNTLADRPP